LFPRFFYLYFYLFLLATWSIEAQVRQEGRASLYDWIVYKRGSKARERKGEEEQRRSMFYMIFWSRDCYCTRLSETVCNCPPQSTSAVTTPDCLPRYSTYRRLTVLRLYIETL